MNVFFNNLKYISLQKIYNYCRISGYYFLRKNKILNKDKSFLPYSISVEPTNICNLNCPECPSGNGSLSREEGSMSFLTYKKSIDELYKNLISINLFFQGEPMLNKDIFEFISYAESKNIYTILSTNAQNLSDNIEKLIQSGLQKLIISLDGITQETYAKYRNNGKIENVFDALKKLSQKKHKIFIELQFIVFKHNEHEIEKLKKLKSEYNVNRVVLKSAQVYNNYDNIPRNQKYSRYKKTSGTYQLKAKLDNSCKRLISSSVITWEGDVVPCCFDKDAKYAMGNINEKSFKEIIKTENYRKFRQTVFSRRKNIDICNNCSENVKTCIKRI